ncbi:hypothetical protein AMTRI_Chr13g85460 [Amborella trichopoda]
MIYASYFGLCMHAHGYMFHVYKLNLFLLVKYTKLNFISFVTTYTQVFYICKFELSFFSSQLRHVHQHSGPFCKKVEAKENPFCYNEISQKTKTSVVNITFYKSENVIMKIKECNLV